MVFLENRPEPQLRGKVKGVEQVLRESGPWRDRGSHRSSGFAFLLQCPVNENNTGCDTKIQKGCVRGAFLRRSLIFEHRRVAWRRKCIFGMTWFESVLRNQQCKFV